MWQILMTRGQSAASAGDLEKALDCYLRGVDEAEHLLEDATFGTSGQNAAAALVVAASNAADIHAELDQGEDARSLMLHVVALLRDTVSEGAATTHVRMGCLPHLDRATSELIHHMQRLDLPGDAIAAETVRTLAATRIFLGQQQAKQFH
jgi:hypothetical protein